MSYLNTTYKVFVAKVAANLYTEMVGKAIDADRIKQDASCYENKDEYNFIAKQATFAAKALAKALEDDWTATNDGTVFFDVSDTPLTKLENAIYEVAEKVDNL